MEVKIYREEENTNLILNETELAEYNVLVKELGISEPENNVTPNVYICMNTAVSKQLKALCPVSVSAENYTRSTIPLEVLKVYKFAKDNNMFDGYEVWYDDVSIDPLLIGWKWTSEEAKAKGYTWQKNRYLIARWGDCAMELPELCKLGYERIKKSLVEKAILSIEKCNSVIKNPDVFVSKILANDTNDMKIDLNTDGSGLIF